MPSNLLAVAEAGMLNDVERMHSISHNLANVSTVGFKREITVSRPFIDQLRESSSVANGGDTRPTLMTWVDQSEGALKYTANPLDLALEGSNGFFVVDSPAGAAYTRQGNFHVDADGRLVTAGGYAVLGEGGEIRLTTPEPRIDAQGRVWEGETQVGELRIVAVQDPQTLSSVGGGIYIPTNSTQLTSEGNVTVRQGFIEAANVVAMKEMIKMIETMRHFEATQKLIRGYDNMLDRAVNQAGDTTG